MSITASEQDLISYAENNAIVTFNIVETDTGKFNLTFVLNWNKKGDVILTTARKDLRKWVQVNSVLAYIKELNVPDVPILIHPYYSKRPKK